DRRRVLRLARLTLRLALCAPLPSLQLTCLARLHERLAFIRRCLTHVCRLEDHQRADRLLAWTGIAPREAQRAHGVRGDDDPCLVHLPLLKVSLLGATSSGISQSTWSVIPGTFSVNCILVTTSPVDWTV